VFSVDPFECFQQSRFGLLVDLRRNDDVLSVGGDLKGRVHLHVQQLQEGLVENEGGAIAVTDEFLGHDQL